MSENTSVTEQTNHRFLASTNHDEKARQDFVRSYKEYFSEKHSCWQQRTIRKDY